MVEFATLVSANLSLRTMSSSADPHRWATELLQVEPLLLDKIQTALAADHENAQTALVEMLKFLYLVAHSPRKLTPALAVDLAWHEFILFTRRYATFCQDKFGRFIHHSPGGSDQENRHNFEHTIRYYGQQWGAPPAVIWGDTAALMYEEAQCGSCLGDAN